MSRSSTFSRLGGAVLAAAFVSVSLATPARAADEPPGTTVEVTPPEVTSKAAYKWSRTMRRGDSGADVKELQVRVAGWINSPLASDRTFQLDGAFGAQTEQAVRNFQTAYGLESDGVAGPLTQKQLDALRDADGTINFSYHEFDDHGCACFTGGKVNEAAVKENVRRLMYRLEALRKKQLNSAVKITSGFRTVNRNAQVGGASNSQHTYGTAADHQVSGRPNRTVRDSARRTAFAAIFCYSNSHHNHADIRANNSQDGISDGSVQDPPRDSQGRDLDSDSRTPCYGESGTSTANLDLVPDATLDDGITGLYLDTDR